MGKAVELINSYLSADISDVLNSSTYYHICPPSADYFHVLLKWKEDDQIRLIYFYGRANATYCIAPFVLKRSDLGDGCSRTAWVSPDTQ